MERDNNYKDVLKMLCWTDKIVLFEGCYHRLSSALLTDSDYLSIIGTADDEFYSIYNITTHVTALTSQHKYVITTREKLTKQESERYIKSNITKQKNIEVKRSEKEQRRLIEMERLNDIKKEFDQWLDNIEANTKEAVEKYKKQSTEYIEKVNNAYNLGEEIEGKLLSFQINPTKQIINAILTNKRVMLASDTGIGKTYMVLAAAKYLRMNVCVICPGTVLTSWARVANEIGVCGDSFTYDTFKNGKSNYLLTKKVVVPELNIGVVSSELMKDGWTPYLYKKSKRNASVSTVTIIGYKYNVDYLQNTIFIFDEAHLCKKECTQNGMIFKQLKIQDGYGAALSATIIDDEKYIYNISDFLGVKEKLQGVTFDDWVNRLIEQSKVPDQFNIILKKFDTDKRIVDNIEKVKIANKVINTYKYNRILQNIHRVILPYNGNRISIKCVGDNFPDNLILANIYDMDEVTGSINSHYQEIKKALEDVKNESNEAKIFNELLMKYQNSIITESELELLRNMADKKGFDIINYKMLSHQENKYKNRPISNNPLAVITRARQNIEILKINNTVDNAIQYLYEDKRPVIFVEFKDSIRGLYEKLNKKFEIEDTEIIPKIAILHGDMNIEERQRNIDRFQSNECNILISTISVGGVGISLHDTDGNFPRVSLFVSIPNKAIDFKQALGRIRRAKGKSKCLQILICCRGTIEEQMANRLKKKLDNIDDINDGDISDEIKFVSES